MANKTIKGEIVLEYLKNTKYKGTSDKTLARKIYKDNKEVFADVESTRSIVRYYRGHHGEKHRLANTVQDTLTELTYNTNPFGIPDAEDEECKPYKLPKANNRILHIQDIHLPYHCVDTISCAIKYGIEHDANTLLIGYDFMDFYMLSKFEKDPRAKSFAYEIEVGKEMLGAFRNAFPNANIYWRGGNHDFRWERYMRVKAPELLDVADFKLENLLSFNNYGIRHIEPKTIVKAGKLNILHGDEFMGGGGSSVNPARGVYLKSHDSTLVGHSHRTSEHIEPNINGDVVGCWSVGSACQLHPEYARINKWNNGFAFINVEKDGMFVVHNKKVVKGKIL